MSHTLLEPLQVAHAFYPEIQTHYWVHKPQKLLSEDMLRCAILMVFIRVDSTIVKGANSCRHTSCNLLSRLVGCSRVT